jgi:hypothetical protein
METTTMLEGNYDTQEAFLNPAILPAAYDLTHAEFQIDLTELPREELEAISELLRGATFFPDTDESTGCWIPRPDLLNDEGYSVISLPSLFGRTPYRSGHRLSYIAANPGVNLKITANGETERLEIHHRCRNKACFRPAHLRVVTREQNEALKHCPEPQGRCRAHGRDFDLFRIEGDRFRSRCSLCEAEKVDSRKARRRAAKA